jgi:hypothetical protein
LIIDDCTNYCWSYFLSKKKDSRLILELRDQNIKVKILRYDDAGERKVLEDECKSIDLGTVFEYAGPRTPQKNEKVKRMFQTLCGQIRDIMATRVTKLSPQELLFGKEVYCAHNLRMFGVMGNVTTKKKIQEKIKNQGTVSRFLDTL